MIHTLKKKSPLIQGEGLNKGINISKYGWSGVINITDFHKKY